MKTILEKLQEDKIAIPATCSGNHTCGQCKIKMLEGSLSITEIEEKLLTSKEIKDDVRLACCHEYSINSKFEILSDKMEILSDMCIDIKGNQEDGYGMIVDIGTTSIVMKWICLSSGESIQTEAFKNPQTTYGGDVISRIKYDNETPHLLNQVLINQLQQEIMKHQTLKIKRMIICGNTTMTHLFLDSDVSSLGYAPFNIPIKSRQVINSKKVFKGIVEDFEIYTFPHIAAFVGGDIVSGILALNIDQEDSLKMMIDLGTNGEIVVGNKDKLITTSTAAGPAFEGVGITCGGPSIPGAITKVIIDNDIKYQTILNKPAKCLCGSGLISLIAELKRKNIINEMGRFCVKQDKFYITENIYITENDIQTFQLAKAAIQAGVEALLNESKNIQEIYISGGFGSAIEVEDLIDLHVFPSYYRDCIKTVKNSALSGAYVLLTKQDYQRLDHIINISSNINLAEYPCFDDYLIDGLYF